MEPNARTRDASNAMLHSLDPLYDAALALIYPQPCAICGRNVKSRHDGIACAQCWHATYLFGSSDTLCWKCGALSQANVSVERSQSVRCGRCDEHQFTLARACGSYDGALRACILQLKRQPHIPLPLGHLMFEVQRREPLKRADVIIPVPLHPARERERGLDQATVLARE